MPKTSNEKPLVAEASKEKKEKLAFSIDEFCQTFGISRALFYKLVTAGKVRPSKILSRTVVTAGEVSRFAAALEAA